MSDQIQDDVIDFFERTNPLEETLAWWEKKRILYNGFLVGSFALVGAICLATNESSSRLLPGIAFLAFWVIGANVCYCTSWGGEFLLRHYFKTTFTDSIRLLTFVVGTVGSVLLTALLAVGLLAD